MTLLSSRLYVHLPPDVHKHVQKLTLFLALSTPTPAFISHLRHGASSKFSPFPQSLGRKFRLRLLAGPHQGHPRLPSTTPWGQYPRSRQQLVRHSRLRRALAKPSHLARFRYQVATLAFTRASGLSPLKWLLCGWLLSFVPNILWEDALVGTQSPLTAASVTEPSYSHTLLGLQGCAEWEDGGSECEGALPSRRSSLWSLPSVTGKGVPEPAQNRAGR